MPVNPSIRATGNFLLFASFQRQLREAEEQYKKATAGGKRMLRDEVTVDDIATVVAMWTGIPVTRLKQSEKEKLLNLERDLHKRVVGQDHAVRRESQEGSEVPTYLCHIVTILCHGEKHGGRSGDSGDRIEVREEPAVFWSRRQPYLYQSTFSHDRLGMTVQLARRELNTKTFSPPKPMCCAGSSGG